MNNKKRESYSNFFKKLKMFFKNIFIREKILELPEENKELNDNQIKEQPSKYNDFESSLKKEIKDYNNKSSIIETIEKNPEILEKLSLERLIQLDKMYEEKILETKIEVEGLKRKLNNI